MMGPEPMIRIFLMSSRRGKKISPVMVEEVIKASRFIEQACLLGDDQKFITAIIVPNFDFLRSWCDKHKITGSNNEELIMDEQVIKHYQKIVHDINKMLGKHEHIKRFRLISDEWSPQTGIFSPTMKLRRKLIQQKYAIVIKEIYGIKKEGFSFFVIIYQK